MGDTNRSDKPFRYRSLDGLRGLAAGVVLIHHCFLVSPLLSAAVDGNGTVSIDPWVWLITFTPLHLLWAGQESVYVFFVISGFVLTLPMLRAGRSTWTAYYLRRLVRIYLPVWASLGFALLTVWIVPRVAAPSLSSWTNLHDKPEDLLADAALISGTGYLNSPLWSLQWEMLFSLLLPAFVVICHRLRNFWVAGVAVLLVCIGIGNALYLAFPVYMPMFGIGVLMACGLQDLEKWACGLNRKQWICCLLITGTLLCTHWLFPRLNVHIAFASLGAAMLVFSFVGWQPVINFGRRSSVRWLGQRSFSLYLVHEPVILAIVFAGGSINPFLLTPFAIPLSLVVAELFFRLIEQPSHKLSAATGTLTDAILERRKDGVTYR